MDKKDQVLIIQDMAFHYLQYLERGKKKKINGDSFPWPTHNKTQPNSQHY